MSDAATSSRERLRAMKDAFDLTFARPRAGPAEPRVDLLLFRAGGTGCAARLSSLRGVVKGATIRSLPTRIDGLLGVASVRGRVVPVYALASMLEAKSVARTTPPFLMISGGDSPLGLAFDVLESISSVSQRDIHPAASEAVRTTRYVAEVASVGSTVRPLLDMVRLEEELTGRRERSGAEGQE